MKTIVLIVAIIALGMAGWYFFAEQQPLTVSAEKHFSIVIQAGKIVSGETTLTVKKGDTVLFSILSDEEEEFHVHGYDRSVDLVAGQEAALSFVADITGRFEFELEESKTELGALEVLP